MEGELGYINDAVNYTAGGFKLLRGQPLPDRLQGGGQTNSSTWSPLLGVGREDNNPTQKKQHVARSARPPRQDEEIE